LNLTTFFAAILIVAPVCGFLPSRAALLETDQDPNPTRETLPPFLRVPDTLPKKDSSAFFAAAFESICNYKELKLRKISFKTIYN